MPEIALTPDHRQATEQRAESLFETHLQEIAVRTDRMFVGLLLFQWLVGIGVAYWISPRTWAGTHSSVHLHVWLAVFLGGAILAYPLLMAWKRPGALPTRCAIALAQMLFSSLLIHLTGGRIETHFHIFGSLAFLAFYRDWRVLLVASSVTAADHFLRGFYLPQSIYGTLLPGGWRWAEHAGWVVFEDIFLFLSISQSRQEMRHIASRQAQNEAAHGMVEAEVVERTAELAATVKIANVLFEDASRENREKNALLFAIPSILISVDQDHKITQWSKAATDAFGCPEEEMLGRIFWECTFPWEWHPINEGVSQCMASDGPVRIEEVRFVRADGKEGALSLSITLIRHAEEDKHSFLILGEDVTERRHLETMLSHAQKMESIGQLAAGIAHEINTPVQYISDNVRFLGEGFATLCDLQKTLTPLLDACKEGTLTPLQITDAEATLEEADTEYLFEEIPRAIAQSLEGVERVAKIVQAMKQFSHPGTTEKTAVDINQIIESTLTVARNEWKYRAELVTDFAPDLPPVSCLPGDFNQVVLNLVVNAAHAIADVVKDSGDKGVITVSTRQKGEVVEIRIADSGTGIPEAARARIFDPFFTTKEAGKGTGQGLAIAHSIMVEKHGGTIGFETELGRGTTFILCLPLLTQEKP